MSSPARTLAVAAALLSACGGPEAAPRRLVLEALRPADADGVYLNEELVLTFSREVDPTSISDESLAIVAADGHRARGRWTVAGRQVRFQPRPVRAPTLDDGGYRPGTQYELVVAGFPRLDGLRGVEGEPLERTGRFAFTTVSVGADQRGFVFDDASPDRGHLAQLKLDPRRPLRIGEPLVVTCAEPLDPSTLRDGDFWLLREGVRGERLPDPQGGEEEHRIPVRGRFRSNHPEGSQGLLGDCAVIELSPKEALEPGTYEFHFQHVALADFRGNRVWPPLGPVVLRVADRPRGLGNQLDLEFGDATGFTSVAVPGAQGLAHWSDGGRLEVRYPAAAGTGEHGRRTLVGTVGQADLHATDLVVPAGKQARLAPGQGLRVLRAQGSLTVAGRLVREVGQGTVLGGRSGGEPFVPGETLTRWLERAGSESWDWTVLVAGGDLSIEGEVEVDTPLLLVAGGWIRVDGRVRQRPGELWCLGEGGGLSLDPTVSRPPILLDPPRTNPLREPLRLAAVTSPLPSQVRAYRWLDLAVGGHGGSGSFRVTFLPPDGPPDPARAVGHPRELGVDGQLRVLFELEVQPGEVWDPPSIDFVHLTWELAN